MRPRVAIDASLVSSSGFLATLVMTTVVYLQALAGSAQVDLPTWTARLFRSALSVVYGWQWSAADGRPMRGWTGHPVG